MKTNLIALILAALGVVHLQAAELEDISEKPILDKPAAGKLIGKEFKVENATLKEGRLKLWQGEGIFTHVEQFEIDLSGKQIGGFSGKTFAVKPKDESVGIDVEMAYTEKKGSIKSSTYLGGYTMRIEFGTEKNGKIPGKIHLRLPDKTGSFVVGTFEATIK